MMRPSQECADLVLESEGCELKAYLCPARVWTIGVGHTGPDVLPGLTISRERAMELLRRDLQDACDAVVAMTRGCSAGELDALTSFVFNLGRGALAGSTLLKHHNSGRRAEAAAEFGKWVHGGGRVLSGLVKRRAKEALLYLR